ncbi:MAG TPA: DNA polymerase/3'-5' exonuclease PolX [Elusimicrobiota bacterium]|nr:DNA polymerase/3'-5' exonuclease PolX [Elusimicrobiota bacterium]
MLNKSFTDLLNEMAVLLELNQDNVFRIRAYQTAAQAVAALTSDIASLTREQLLEVSGIGKGIADKIEEFVKTGHVKEHDDLKEKFPAGLLDLLNVSGLGPKRARLLYDELKIDSFDKLKKAAAAGRLQKIPGFGEKIEQNILKGLHLAEQARSRMLLWEARRLVNDVLLQLRGVPGLLEIEPAGSLRRGKETVGDLDILCASRNPDALIERFTHLPSVERVLAAGATKSSVLLSGGVQCDLRVVAAGSFGAALQYFTGSKEHNVALRERALRMGYTVNEYGLYRVSDKKQAKPVAGKTEQDIYKKLGLSFIPPELRENRGEIAAAEKNRLPELLEESDVKGCFHNHTDLSDGTSSLEDMADAAEKKGWEWYAVGDHSQSLKVAGGMAPAAVRKKIEKIRALNKKRRVCRLLSASEVDILADGRMDYADDLLAEIDVVTGSIHSGFHQSEEQITGRLVKAMENPHVDCIAHLSGRLLGRREPYAFNTDKVLQVAERTGTALEINGQPDRQDLTDINALAAKKRGIPMAVSTDAHSTEQLNYMSIAVTVARRAWLEKSDILNTKTYPELLEWLKD